MDVWKDLYDDCLAAEIHFNKQIEKHQKAISKLQKIWKRIENFLKKILIYLLTNV